MEFFSSSFHFIESSDSDSARGCSFLSLSPVPSHKMALFAMISSYFHDLKFPAARISTSVVVTAIVASQSAAHLGANISLLLTIHKVIQTQAHACGDGI